MFRTSNPTLRASMFTDRAAMTSPSGAMTLQGTINKSGLLLVIVMVSAMFTWNKTMQSLSAGADVPTGFILGGIIGGLVLALVTVFKRHLAPITTPLYAAAEGLFLGVISAVMERTYPGIVTQAIFATFGVFAVMLFLYKSRIIRPSEKFKLGIVAATGGIFFVYLISMVLGFFGVAIPLIHSSGPIGIIFSVVVVGIAALNLVLDFDLVEQGAASSAPKYMEWYASFALLVTLIWLYIEILHLLAKLNSRR